MKTILLLKEIHIPRVKFLIDVIANRWADMGYRVISHFGSESLPAADIVVLHVDKTVIPAKFTEVLEKFPVVLNRNIIDISKKRISSNILRQEDVYSGPVIVKTNANFGGLPEFNYRRFTEKIWIKPGGSRKKLTEIEKLDPNNYPIFRKKENVPDGIWHNPNLVVEKFLPEMQDGMFFLRYYVFLGNKGWAARFGSKVPIAKFTTMATPEESLEVPSELQELRREMGFDYGRFDYVEHNGKSVILDVNKTLGGAHHVDKYKKQLDLLASGIKAFG